MQHLTLKEVDQVNGGGVLGTAGAALGGAAVIACGLAAVPTPASPGLLAFGVVAGVLGATFAAVDALTN
jgi:hypothetical protein